MLNTGVSTRAAMQSAVQLTAGLFAQTYGHVDPMQLGEAGRAMKIAQKYGELLQRKSQNFDAGTLTRLAEEYPSHGFIIDRHEAANLFKNVRCPNALEEVLIATLGHRAIFPQQSSEQLFMAYLSAEQPEPVAQAPTGTAPTPPDQVADHDKTQDPEPSTAAEGPDQHSGGHPEASGHPHIAEVRPISGAA